MKRGILSSALILLTYTMLLGQTTTSTYYYAHSLIWHKKETNSQANIPFWLAELEKAAGDKCLTSGKHVAIHWDPPSAKIPPSHSWSFSFSNHGSAMAPNGPYVAGKHDHVVLTYMNWEIIYDWGASIGLRNPNTIHKATDSIAVIFTWLNKNDPGIFLNLYECWPKIEKNYIMGGQDWSPSTGKAPSSAQWVNYLNYATGNSNGFWKDLQDSLIKKAGIVNTKLIPSSMICAKLWRQGGLLSDMPVDSIFEDLGPHGKPSSYFLAAMIVYSAQHKKPPVKPFASHPQIDQRILDRFSDISAFIMTELNAFNFPNGESRVWENTATKIEESKELSETNIKIYPNPSSDFIYISKNNEAINSEKFIYNSIGKVVYRGSENIISLSHLASGIYILKVENHIIKIIKN
ncbi:MAG: T9SS type A sorting domain-containing protein [Candidatus Methylopumilus sp.]